MTLYTIGFSGKSAETFFGLLKQAGIRSVLDIRLSNRGQLAGFTKEDDLKYFLDSLLGIGYYHRPDLAPDHALMDDYRKKRIKWDVFAVRFEALMQERNADNIIKEIFGQMQQPVCILCSEAKASVCHRSLVSQRVQKIFPGTELIHL